MRYRMDKLRLISLIGSSIGFALGLTAIVGKIVIACTPSTHYSEADIDGPEAHEDALRDPEIPEADPEPDLEPEAVEEPAEHLYQCECNWQGYIIPYTACTLSSADAELEVEARCMEDHPGDTCNCTSCHLIEMECMA
jgi:hypothetical protein